MEPRAVDHPNEFSQNFLPAIFDEAANFVWVLDSTGKLIHVNESLVRLFDISAAGFGSLTDLFSPDSVVILQHFLEQSRSRCCAGWRSILTLNLPGNQTRPVDHVITPVYAATGEIFHILGIGSQALPESLEDAQQIEEQAFKDALLDISRSFSSNANLQQLLGIILERTQKLIPFVSGCIFVPKGKNIDVAAFLGYKDFNANPVELVRPLTLSELVNLQSIAESRSPMLIPDVTVYPGWQPGGGSEYIQSWLGAPIMTQDAVVGFISLDHTDKGFFTPQHARNLTAIAGQVSVAIQYSILLEEANQKIREAALLAEIAATVASTLETAEVTHQILEQMKRVIPLDTAAIMEIRGDMLVLIAGIGFSNLDEIIGMVLPITPEIPTHRILQEKKPLIIADAKVEYPIFLQPRFKNINSWMGIPLFVHGEMIGNITFDSAELNHFTAEHARIAVAVADQTAIFLLNARLFEETHQKAVTDSLTGILNRRQFMALGEKEFGSSLRYGDPVSILMLDFDFFKRINDQFGHKAGDFVLQMSANNIKQLLRSSDLIGRYGGEEFIILLPRTNQKSACLAAGRIQQIISDTSFLHDQHEIHVTVSIGISTFTPNGADQAGVAESILENQVDLADKALYQAKNMGRNRVIAYGDRGE